ncbi:S26 family signal peptidase [Micromonospora profundi]|uniref:signal peptidase I n=1 Tax=Micromonospora profundi TaxID=1420889 RepID=A0AAJ6L358_9ACTN|nr:S26 family signal peptidase [Micromonospora profundi]WLS46605.1 S26 family signal peptidase [Micromonospora profundi]
MAAVAGLISALALLGGAAVWVARRQLVMITVTGGSMHPSLNDGDTILVRKMPLRAIRADMIVVFAHPRRHEEASANAGGAATDLATTWLIKRVVAVPGEPVPPELGWNDQTVPAGCLVVYGDNRRSSHDSRHFGYVRRADVRGVAVQKHLPDRGRRRLVENSPGEGPWQRTYRHRGTA